jgi:tetratricopeptide (TPR) repeat protein
MYLGGDVAASRAIAEEGLALADRLNLPQVSWRAINNLSITVFVGEGDSAGATRLSEEGLRRAERLGVVTQTAWFQGYLAITNFFLGRFDEALRFAELALEVERHYRTTDAFRIRAKIRLARDDRAGAAADIEHALEFAQRIGELQALMPAYGEGALVLSALGRRDEASAFVESALDAVRTHVTSGNVDPSFVALARVAAEFGRAADFLDATDNIRYQSPWLAAARTYARGDLVEAVELLSGLSVPDTALLRLQLAKTLLAHDRRADADRELAQALAFWRSVGATRYIRECEVMLAATA